MNRKHTLIFILCGWSDRTGFQIRDIVLMQNRGLYSCVVGSCELLLVFLFMWWSDVLTWSIKDTIVLSALLCIMWETWTLGIRGENYWVMFCSIYTTQITVSSLYVKQSRLWKCFAMWPLGPYLFWSLEHRQNGVIQREQRLLHMVRGRDYYCWKAPCFGAHPSPLS